MYEFQKTGLIDRDLLLRFAAELWAHSYFFIRHNGHLHDTNLKKGRAVSITYSRTQRRKARDLSRAALIAFRTPQQLAFAIRASSIHLERAATAKRTFIAADKSLE